MGRRWWWWVLPGKEGWTRCPERMARGYCEDDQQYQVFLSLCPFRTLLSVSPCERVSSWSLCLLSIQVLSKVPLQFQAQSLGLKPILSSEPQSPTNLCQHLWEMGRMGRFSKSAYMGKVLGGWRPLLRNTFVSHVIGSLSISVIRKTQIN